MTESTFYNKHNVEAGTYNYFLPYWEKSVRVSVLFIDNEKFVSFEKGMYPVKIYDIPELAVFEKEQLNPLVDFKRYHFTD